MKKFALAAAVLLFVGFGCSVQPVVIPQPIPAPAPAPAPDPYGPAAHADLIVVDSPMPGDGVTSPLTVTGRARGSWYFEASFPVQLLDADGDVLASGPAQAQGDWMTQDFVPFKITLTFKTPAKLDGMLVLKKDNPSGLPANEDQLRVPVVFKASAKTIAGGCHPAGCYGQICADQDEVVPMFCLNQPSNACYKDAKCERQSDGKCGWTSSAALTACLDAAAKTR